MDANFSSTDDNGVRRKSFASSTSPRPEIRRLSVTNQDSSLLKKETQSYTLIQRSPEKEMILPACSASDFSLSKTQLLQLVCFEERINPEQVKLLNNSYGGPNGLANLLLSDPETGVGIKGSGPRSFDPVDLHIRHETYGVNIVPPQKSESILQIVIGTIRDDPIIKVLLFGALVITIIGIILKEGWVEGIAILVAVLIVLVVTAGNDYSKERKFKKMLLLQSDKKAKVIRGGIKDRISSWDIIVGDVVELIAGDEVPADGVLLKGARLVIDESPLTGESFPVKKSSKEPFLFSGCQVAEGTGTLLVTAVGSASSAGQIQVMLNEAQNTETVLQFKLRQVAVFIGKIGFSAGIITFLGLTIRYVISAVHKYADIAFPPSELMHILHFFVVSVTVIVVAVPEGLPLAVTISLSFSMFKMIRDRCFVRHLGASETMGEATTICTDKTGTLTENRMKVVKIFLGNSSIHGEGSCEPDSRPFSKTDFYDGFLSLLCENICLNSTCFLKFKNDQTPVFVGSATEGALLVFADGLGYKYEELRQRVPKLDSAEYFFTSERKRMSVICETQILINDKPCKNRLYTKGASETVLKLCKYMCSPEKNVSLMSQEYRSSIELKINEWAAQGLRTLVVAYRDIDKLITNTDLEQELTFIALFGIKDPVRHNVPAAVQICQSAGIYVRMVTGDNVLTATKIAKECNILQKQGIVMEGPAFRALSDAEKRKIVPQLQVLARSSPSDKYELVTLLKEIGEVVAVTGDGTNDAAALKAADIGFAMGISGTQIAMNACDIILLDDNFVSIVQSIKWGRNVLESVRKFLQFQLSVNLVAVIITIIGSIAQSDVPLSAVQLLWVNLIMDTLGALGLASDLPDDDILKKKSHSRTEKILTFSMQHYIFLQTTYQVTVLLVLMFWTSVIPFDAKIYNDEEKWNHTIIFTTFVLMQITNEILSRQLDHEINIFRGILKNRLFGTMIVLILGIQILMVQFAGSVMNTIALGLNDWITCSCIALTSIPVILIFRIIIQIHRVIKRPKPMQVTPTQILYSARTPAQLN